MTKKSSEILADETLFSGKAAFWGKGWAFQEIFGNCREIGPYEVLIFWGVATLHATEIWEHQ